MVCDGSYHTNMDDNRGAASWGMHCKDMERYVWGSLPTTPQVENKYRSELIRLYGILQILA